VEKGKKCVKKKLVGGGKGCAKAPAYALLRPRYIAQGEKILEEKEVQEGERRGMETVNRQQTGTYLRFALKREVARSSAKEGLGGGRGGGLGPSQYVLCPPETVGFGMGVVPEQTKRGRKKKGRTES